jgi:hypothetical protein
MCLPASDDNDITARAGIWRELPGDRWAAFDALPPAIRRRIAEHAYDPWSVNALALWRAFLRRTGSRERAERRLLRHIEECEALERANFAAAHRAAHGTPLPHEAARASVLRYCPLPQSSWGRSAPTPAARRRPGALVGQ